jgi:hypothetical protein
MVFSENLLKIHAMRIFCIYICKKYRNVFLHSSSPPMHAFHSHRPLWHLRLSSLALWGMLVGFLLAMGMGLIAVLHADVLAMKKTIFCVCLVVALALLYRLMAGSASCPLCHNQPLVAKGCQKHRKARQLLGSYRLEVASSVLLHNSFRCPYCGESSRCRVRERRVAEEDFSHSPHSPP